jgi:hypothetical protein
MYYDWFINVLQVMYSYSAIGTEKKSSSSFLDDAPIHRVNMDCTGVQSCEYLAPSLKDMHHYAVTPELLNSIREARLANSADSRQRDANRCEYIANIFIVHTKSNTIFSQLLLRRARKVYSTNSL